VIVDRYPDHKQVASTIRRDHPFGYPPRQNAGSKYDKAVELGVTILDGAALRTLLADGPDAVRNLGDGGWAHLELFQRSQPMGWLD
jgi:hypothetical protein